jgi:hypothetical protein
MEGEERPSKLGDALLTIPAVWLILILAGLSCARLQPAAIGAMLSVAACVVLLFIYGHWTGPGRRTAFPVYLLAGLLYPILSTLLVLSVSPGAFDSLQWLTAGMVIGYQPGGGPDAPFEYYLVPMLVNLFGPILAMGALRQWARAASTD